MAARGEVRVTVCFGPTASLMLDHAACYAIEHASVTEELRSGVWEATFLIGGDERTIGELHHLVCMVFGWKSTRIEVNGSPEHPMTVLSMLSCAREWLINKGSCGEWFPFARGPSKCRLCPLYDSGYAGEFWVPRRMSIAIGGETDPVPDFVPEDWSDA